MTTESTTETSQENKDVAPETTPAPTISPTEASAREQGWVPKEEWIASGKPEDEWRNAREYVERGELFNKIHELQNETKKTTKAFKALVEHHKKVRETAIAEAVAKLKLEKKAAAENNDAMAILSIDEEIERVKATPVEVPNIDVQDAPPISDTFKKWHMKNTWYDLNGKDEVSQYANFVGPRIRADNPDMSEGEWLKAVEKQVAKTFPKAFENKSSQVPEVSPKRTSGPADESGFKLTAAEEEICKGFVAMGVMTRKEYIDELKKVRGA